MTKRLSLFILAAGFIAFNSCTSAPDADKAETTEAKEVTATDGEALKVDPAASKVEWIGTKVSGYHEGTVNVKGGELKVKDGGITGGNFVLDLTSLTVTGPKDSDTAMNNKLLGHLKSPDFFDVAANPDASFVITEVKPFSGTVKDTTDPRQEAISKYKVANPTHSISGNLTIKGVTKNIEFPASVTVNAGTVDAIAKFNIDRSQWNIIYPGKPDDLIRNEVHLGIALKAAK